MTTAVTEQPATSQVPAARAGSAVAAPGAPAAPTPNGPLDSVLQQLRLPPKMALILAGGLVAVAVAGVMLWGRAPEYKVLYAQVSDRDGGAIVASLQQMNVPYKFSEGGSAILVPSDRAAEARLKLAAQGLPKSGGVGFELLDNQRFGTSQFTEQVNYQRGLEGELARSIESIGAVQAARVHLALPKSSLFVRDQKKPSAAVVLSLHPGRSVDEAQVSAIVHLISSSVPELDAKSVSVVDQRGNLLSAAHSGRSLDGSQLKYVENIEQSYVRRIEAILQPIVGLGNVRAQVAADVDFSVVEATDERYAPNGEPGKSAIRSQQSSESAQDGGSAAGGVPGALSNQPPLTATAPISAPSAPAATASSARSARGSSRRDMVTNYEVDRSVRHTQHASGVTKRLSVAVVVNHREVVKNGAKTAVPLTAAELEQVRNLVKEAMGFSEARGDSLNVVNTSFSVDIVERPQVPAWREPANIELAKSAAQYLVILLAALIVALALRRRRPAAAPVELKEIPNQPAGESEDEELALPGAGEKLALPQAEEDPEKAVAMAKRKANLEYAQQMSHEQPTLVASLVRHWMDADTR